jgi:hypothetical protein
VLPNRYGLAEEPKLQVRCGVAIAGPELRLAAPWANVIGSLRHRLSYPSLF